MLFDVPTRLFGPTVPLQNRPEYEIDEDGNVTRTTVSQDTVEPTSDVNEFKCLIGTIHRDDEDLELYKTVDVLEEEFDEDEGPLIVAYRRRLKTNGTLSLLLQKSRVYVTWGHMTQTSS